MKSLSLSMLLGLLFASVVTAAAPSQMNVQGRLLIAGSPMTGAHPAIFKIYDDPTAGTLLWSESSSLNVQAGIFSATIGAVNPIPALVFDSQPRWLEVTVDGTTLGPRLLLATSPYAFRSQRADTANIAITALGGGSAGPWSDDGSRVTVQSRQVGVNTTSTAAAVDVFMGPNSRALNINAGYGDGVVGSYIAEYLTAAYGINSSGTVTGLQVDVQNLGTGQTNAAVFNGGNVGIGTPSPTELLQLETSSGTAAMLIKSYVPGTGSYGAIHFQNTLATGAGVAAEIAAVRPVATWGQESDLLFATNPGSANPALAERMRITKDGNVGIGTTHPMDQLEVAGNVTIGPYDGTLDDVVLRAAGGCPNCGGNSEGGSNLVLRSGIGTGVGPSGDIVFQVSDNANYGNQQPHGVIEAMRIQTTTGNVSINGNLTVAGTKCRVVHDTTHGDLYFNAVESADALFTLDGQGTMRNGRARIVLDPKWLTGVTIDDQYPMQVWITFYGPHGDYYVQRATSNDGFTVIDQSGSGASFGWKVEARQKGYERLFLDQPSSSSRSDALSGKGRLNE